MIVHVDVEIVTITLVSESQHTTGERETAEASGNTVAHSSRSSVEPAQGSAPRESARGAVHERRGPSCIAKTAHFATKRLGKLRDDRPMQRMGVWGILKRWRTEEPVATKLRSGRPRTLSDADMHTLECLSEELKCYFAWESLAALFTERTGKRAGHKTVYNSCKAAGWRQVCERYVPCLNAKDVARRLEWAKQHLDYTWTGTENLRYPNVWNRKV